VVVALAVIGWLRAGVTHAARPASSPVPSGARLPAVGFPRFAEIGFSVSARAAAQQASGPDAGSAPSTTLGPLCALLATTPAQRGKGLMGVRSLGSYAGMVFAFPEPSTDAFYMKDTPMPLLVVWYDAGGKSLASAHMAPCRHEPCRIYRAPAPYTTALEVPGGGGLAAELSQPSTIALAGACGA